MGLKILNTRYATWQEAIRQCSERFKAIGSGRSNAYGSFTCTVSAASTVVSDANVGVDSVISCSPTTANAATEIATMYIGTVADGSFTVTHANSAVADRTFKYSIQG